MPMHDWTRVSAGTYHDFHSAWTQHLKEALNEGILPEPYESPQNRPLTLVSYCVARPVTAYVEPIQVGASLVAMPLFLTPDRYVPAPLEETYMQAFRGVPRRWRRVIEATG